jgi:hypothetical protein
MFPLTLHGLSDAMKELRRPLSRAQVPEVVSETLSSAYAPPEPFEPPRL